MSSNNNLQVSTNNSSYDLAPFPLISIDELQVFTLILSPIFSPLHRDKIMESCSEDGIYYTIDNLKALSLWGSLCTLTHYVLRAAYHRQYGEDFATYLTTIPLQVLQEISLEFPSFILTEEFHAKNPLLQFCPSVKLCYEFYMDLKTAGCKAICWIQAA
ncbi:hypothetical protein BDQ17DRAFT_1426622 [Cyathus striatus]|nr:hypothetical protein BDQ17DRAFT_1426622 [Cyathus striatus]